MSKIRLHLEMDRDIFDVKIDKLIVPWCNWQHVALWMRRVQVRPLKGQHNNVQ